jgi:hypothetical protein
MIACSQTATIAGAYERTECNWHYDVRLFDINSAEYWIVARDFEMHDRR